MFDGLPNRSRSLPHDPQEVRPAALRAEAIREQLPVWARHAIVKAISEKVVITLDDECSASRAKIAELEGLLRAQVPGEISVERTLRYQHIYGLVAAAIDHHPDLRLKLDRQAPIVYVILPSAHYPRSEELRMHIEGAVGLRTCLVLSDPSHRPIVLLPTPSAEVIQATIEKTHLRFIRRRIAAIIPETWRATVEVNSTGVAITYAGMLRSCQEEERVRAKVGEITPLPVRIAPQTRRDNLQDALYSTVPEGIEVWRSSFYKFNLRQHEYRCAVIHLHIPAGRDSEALAWRLALEERFGVHLILQPERVSFSLGRQLSTLADQRGLIISAEPVRDLKMNLNGRAPPPEVLSHEVSPLGPVMDLRRLGFLTFDSVATREPEDALFAESLSDGTIRLYVSFTDVSRAVPPDSKLARHARRAGFSLYHGDTAVPMLGEMVTYEQLSLIPGAERLTWTVEMDVSPRGKIVRYDFYRALIKVAAAHAHVDFDGSAGRAVVDDQALFGRLQQVANLLERRGIGYRGFVKIEPTAPSDHIVSACMVTARERIAHFFSSRGIAVPFRVHGPPGARQRRHFMQTARAIGLRVRPDDFGDPERFSDLLDTVERHPAGRHLFHEILDAHLQRARFSRYRGPHIGAKCEQYTEIKGLRTYAGLLTQWQADRYFSTGSGLLSSAQMEREVRHLNRKARGAGQNTQRLAMLQRIEERLSAERVALEAVVEEDTRGTKLLYVPALGVLGIPVGFSPEKLQTGTQLAVILGGYHVRSMRYAFTPIHAPGSLLGSGTEFVSTDDTLPSRNRDVPAKRS